jgi:hypothetical protein
MDEITPVAVPTVAQETARDLVRAREDARGGACQGSCVRA